MWWTQSYVALCLLVECMLAEKSFDDLESMGFRGLIALQPGKRLHELSMPSKSSSSIDAPL